MTPQLSDELKSHAEKVLNGDILNMPLLHKQEVEKILYYLVSFLNHKIERQKREMYDRLEDLDDVKKELKMLKQTLQAGKGKKWK